MKNLLSVFLIMALLDGPSWAQQSMLPVSDEEQVSLVIHELFEGYRTGDSLRVKKHFTDSAFLQTAYIDKAGKSQLSEVMHIAKFINYIGGGLEKVHDERLWNTQVHVDNNLASVWTNYAFYLDGQFSHCGAENFLLIKQNNMWKVFHLVDTRQQIGCQIPDTIKNQ